MNSVHNVNEIFGEDSTPALALWPEWRVVYLPDKRLYQPPPDDE